MTRSRREGGQVLSVHESVDILRACENRKRREARDDQGGDGSGVEEPSTASISNKQSVPKSSTRRTRKSGALKADASSPPRRITGASLSEAASGFPPSQRFRSVNSIKPAGAAAVARTLAKKGEIDLRTPEAPKPACIGAAQASQAKARLFASPAGDASHERSEGASGSQKRKRQTTESPLQSAATESENEGQRKRRPRLARGLEKAADVAERDDAAEQGTAEEELRSAPERGTSQASERARKRQLGGPGNKTGPDGERAEQLLEVPHSAETAEQPLEFPQGSDGSGALRDVDEGEGSLEVPETSGAMQETPGDSGLAVDEAVKVLKRQLLGVDGWRGMQGKEGRTGVMDEFQAHQKKLYTLLADTVEKGLNVSALLLGARGGGKSMIVERVIHDLQEAFQERVTVVRLNGLLHSDERTALKEIARQLVEDNDLAISSKTSTFELNLRFLTDILTECVRAHRAVIFVLDEFDLFTQRPKQTLLYNLLDAIQSSKTQAAVVGISCRLDADELLEKRVRSRFSHRRIQVLEPRAEELVRILANALQLPPSFPHSDFATRFNEAVEAVLADSDVQSLLDIHVSRNQSPRHILDLGFRALCLMERNRGYLTVEDLTGASAAIEMEPRVESMRGLSVLELYLVIAMKRLEEKERDKFNFNMVFAEYQELRYQNTADLYSRGVSLRAFQHLLGRELIAFVDRRPRGDPVEFRPVKLLVAASEIEQALSKHPARSSVLDQWFANKAAGKF